MDVYSFTGLDGLTIGDAGVIEPARAIAAKRAVDDPPIGQSKKERVALLTETAMAGDGLLPAHDRAGVLKDEFARADRS